MTEKRARPGRPKGARNKRTQELYDAAKEAGMMPVDYMLQEMRDDSNPKEFRMDAAKAAAPYLHQRLKSLEVTAAISEMSHEEWLKTLR